MVYWALYPLRIHSLEQACSPHEASHGKSMTMLRFFNTGSILANIFRFLSSNTSILCTTYMVSEVAYYVCMYMVSSSCCYRLDETCYFQSSLLLLSLTRDGLQFSKSEPEGVDDLATSTTSKERSTISSPLDPTTMAFCHYHKASYNSHRELGLHDVLLS